MTGQLDVIVIGAGPYGLATSAQLRRAGANVHTIGAPMSFWKQQMPKGMWLRSPWAASHIGDRRSGLTLDAFERTLPRRLVRPIPLPDFLAYAAWFQEQAIGPIDTRPVRSVEPTGEGFRVTVDDGETLEARRVVVAAGIAPFAQWPAEFTGLPAHLASHTSDHDDLASFRGRRIAVIGGGQSAIESAVLLGERGAEVEVIMRAPRLKWVGRATRHGAVGRLLFDRTDVGPALVSHLVARPRVLRQMSAAIQAEVMRRSIASGASLWLRPRLGAVKITAARRVARASRSNGHLDLYLDDGSTRSVDHALLGTGYRVDVRRYDFLSPNVRMRIACANGFPILKDGLESSIAGLHFAGAPACASFGPLLRFVAGTEFASREIASAITGTSASDRAAEMPLDMRAERNAG
jgi:cation diffusion facilitator CzcD-associated flavoprotein CzcO